MSISARRNASSRSRSSIINLMCNQSLIDNSKIFSCSKILITNGNAIAIPFKVPNLVKHHNDYYKNISAEKISVNQSTN